MNDLRKDINAAFGRQQGQLCDVSSASNRMLAVATGGRRGNRHLRTAFAGVAGSLFVLATNGFAQPNEFGVILSLQILIGAAVAGLGSLWGVLVGALFVGLLPTVSAGVPLVGSAHGQDVVFGLIVILIMLALPNGFAGLLARLAGAKVKLD